MSWWHNAVIYQVYPRTFFDADNDGIGDLYGVTAKLDYLSALGIDAIWLSPFYPSPLNDGGYDISDPRDVAIDLGGMKAFDDLISEAKKRNLRVIIDLVPNHFSIEHKWFKQALAAKPGSAERSRFHFLDGNGDKQQDPPNNWISLFGGSAWTRTSDAFDGTSGQWYLHIFDSSQPDLNWNNQEIRDDFLETINFWLDRGVSGFRVDVALGLFKDESYKDDIAPQLRVDAIRLDLYDPLRSKESEETRKWVINSPIFDRDEVHAIYRSWSHEFSKRSTDVFAVAEAWAYPLERTMEYAKSLGQVFNFDFMVIPFEAELLGEAINQIISASNSYSTSPTWVLSNHDSSRVVTRLGGAKSGLNKARSLFLLSAFLPGSLYIFQGDELGLEDAQIPAESRLDPIWKKSGFKQAGRDGSRAPIPWDSELPNRGFSSAEKTWLPSPTNWPVISVKEQQEDSESTLNFYRQILQLRRKHPLWFVEQTLTSAKVEGEILQVRRGTSGRAVINAGNEAIDLIIDSDEKILIETPGMSFLERDGRISIPSSGAIILFRG